MNSYLVLGETALKTLRSDELQAQERLTSKEDARKESHYQLSPALGSLEK